MRADFLLHQKAPSKLRGFKHPLSACSPFCGPGRAQPHGAGTAQTAAPTCWAGRGSDLTCCRMKLTHSERAEQVSTVQSMVASGAGTWHMQLLSLTVGAGRLPFRSSLHLHRCRVQGLVHIGMSVIGPIPDAHSQGSCQGPGECARPSDLPGCPGMSGVPWALSLAHLSSLGWVSGRQAGC